MGVEFLTLHGNRATLKAAQRGRRLAGRANPKFLSVTLLSSLDQTDLKDILFTDNIALDEYIDKRTEQLLEAGCDAVIASGDSVADIRAKYGTRVIIVTPGIRPAGASQNDHKRALTPRQAILAGSDYLVVGRPIHSATDPAKAAKDIINEIDIALTDSRSKS